MACPRRLRPPPGRRYGLAGACFRVHATIAGVAMGLVTRTGAA
ncbi:hypothetical protein [Nonomuraea rhizosphaerae]|nr:hypothetical protein [Nonomuraea rhizosphaerae]